MTGVLDGCHAKLERADEHMSLLNAEWETFLREEEPYGVERESDSDPFDYPMTIEPLEPVPPRIGAILGDAVHDLRSPLDHVICALVEANGGKCGKQHAFPIFTNRDEWVERVEKGRRSPLKGVPSRVWTEVKNMQPYTRGDRPEDDPLAVLNDLSNRDKHRILNPSFVFPDPNRVPGLFSWHPDAELIDQQVFVRPSEPLVGKTDLVRLRFSPKGAEPRVEVKRGLPLDIAFGDEPGGRVSYIEVRDLVAALVNRLWGLRN